VYAGVVRPCLCVLHGRDGRLPRRLAPELRREPCSCGENQPLSLSDNTEFTRWWNTERAGFPMWTGDPQDSGHESGSRVGRSPRPACLKIPGDGLLTRRRRQAFLGPDPNSMSPAQGGPGAMGPLKFAGGGDFWAPPPVAGSGPWCSSSGFRGTTCGLVSPLLEDTVFETAARTVLVLLSSRSLVGTQRWSWSACVSAAKQEMARPTCVDGADDVRV